MDWFTEPAEKLHTALQSYDNRSKHRSPRPVNEQLAREPDLIPALTDPSTTLREYYFSRTCRILSGFDSPKNPLREWVSRLSMHEPVIHFCMLSISAAHVSQKKCRTGALGLKHHVNALSSLANEVARRDFLPSSRSPDDSNLRARETQTTAILLLGIVMIGITSSWHDPFSLGLQHLHAARTLFQQHVSRNGALSFQGPPDMSDSSARHFFVGALAYWEALASFIVDQNTDVADYLLPFYDRGETTTLSIHPWSGVSTTLFIYLSKVGSIARQLRHLRKPPPLQTRAQMLTETRNTLLLHAASLEESVSQYRVPAVEAVSDTDDPFAPVGHFQTLARVYQLSSLLELYRNFPELLAQKTRTIVLQQDAVFHSNYRDRLNALAIDILSLVASIPETSGTRASQMLALIIAGSTLQFQGDMSTEGNVQSLDGTSTPAVIGHWRSFVDARLGNMHRFVGLKTVNQAGAIVKETWERADLSGLASGRGARMDDETPVQPATIVHWIDVMIEKGLETILG
ncbi:hypothetical protein P170DRAFT_462718 [Aspergillus steynii IBT 23096]|uniref:Zn(II)2Cys6 transcription factor n=1 Tax=Aspergillus steynii IBT 23096 TaxID=1392250 RepID=A0A2I2GJ28_9EURO|nr:uncharacterized protein P170DRAFT_462718 [Aspergillus steynii IBT 23096]PLB52881.1 hypothetical protein P170DRAFT_462718 [Aspergillus steynii IBT 23096]